MNLRKRNWCFTDWHDEGEYGDYRNWEELPRGVRYIVWQEEECENTGRLHLQGYIEFEDSTRMQRVKQTLGSEVVHLEGRKGTAGEASTYCKKRDTRVEGGLAGELGELGGRQGHRSDLESVSVDVLAGKPIRYIAKTYPASFIRYNRGIKALRFHTLEIPDWRSVRTLVLHGTTGSGKTRLARHIGNERGGGVYCIRQPEGSQTWWDGYDGQRTLIIDEFYGWFKWSLFLGVLDGHELRLPVKGDHSYALWDLVIITSNREPIQWYERGIPPELKRRIGRTEFLSGELSWGDVKELTWVAEYLE